MLSKLSVDRFLAEKPLAITVSGLEELRAHIVGRIAAFDAAPREFLASVAEDMKAAAGDSRGRQTARGVGVIQIRGTISQHAQADISAFLFGGTATELVSKALREFVADDSIGKIVLDIDSPGGSSAGVSELANEILKARAQKPIVAVANSVAASAAYWIGSAADVFYAAPGALAGSIGVYMLHMDFSQAAEKEGVKPTYISAGEHKTEGNQFEPLSDEARAHVQSIVDDVYAQFVTDVARGRGVSEATVRNTYGKGRVLTAKQAKAVGMVDGIYTLEQAISRPFQPRNSQQSEPEAESSPVDVVASVNDENLRVFSRMRLKAMETRAPA